VYFFFGANQVEGVSLTFYLRLVALRGYPNMANNGTNGHTNSANGINGKAISYSIPKETRRIFEDGIMQNPLIASTLPKEIGECAQSVRFEGTDKPSIPINWRFAESMASLKGLEAAMINVLLKRKYGLEPQEAVINT